MDKMITNGTSVGDVDEYRYKLNKYIDEIYIYNLIQRNLNNVVKEVEKVNVSVIEH